MGAFTLVEISMVMAMLMLLAAALIMMLQSHVTFMRILQSYTFLRDDAPQVNNMLTGIFGKANSYRIYSSVGNAKANTGSINVDGKAVRLSFRSPDGSYDEGIVAFEVVAGEAKLNFYSFDGAWNVTPNWTITQQASTVTFADDTGILLVTLTGPNGEQVTYGGTGE
ncbi:MAG: hypothetical protein QM496_08665 [Verrucomicrobiota bacterium]